MYDSVIIGKGPAGITAAIYLKRAGFNCLVIGKDGGNLEKNGKIQNYYGIEEITGKELLIKGIKQAENLGIEVITDEAIELEYSNKFLIKTINNKYEAKTIILATGNKRKTPNIEGINNFNGKGISYCAVCDGFFYKNKEVAVIGSGEYAINEVNHLLPLAKKVTLLTDGKTTNNDSISVDINSREIKEFRGDAKLQEIEFKDNSKLKVDGVFLAIGTATSTDLAQRLGALIKDNRIIVDEKMKTNVNGLFAAGDCTGGLLQISKAVYEGSQAGLSAVEYLKKLKGGI